MTFRFRHLMTIGLAAILLPAAARAQTPATTFDELARIVAAGDTVTVTERDGQRTTGKLQGVANGFLSIKNRSNTKTFAQATVASVTRRDSPIQGLLIGAGAGTLAAALLVHGTCGGGDQECEAIATPVWYLTMVPGGAVAGALIDKYTGGDRVYTAPGTTKKSVTIIPAVGPHAGGLVLSLRF